MDTDNSVVMAREKGELGLGEGGPRCGDMGTSASVNNKNIEKNKFKKCTELK